MIALVYPNAGVLDFSTFLAIVSGVVLVIALDRLTEYFTSTHFAPVKETGVATGAATNILSGLALGNESSTYAALVIGVSIFASVLIFGADGFTAILYGVALTGIGMLMLTGNTISMDAFCRSRQRQRYRRDV